MPLYLSNLIITMSLLLNFSNSLVYELLIKTFCRWYRLARKKTLTVTPCTHQLKLKRTTKALSDWSRVVFADIYEEPNRLDQEIIQFLEISMQNQIDQNKRSYSWRIGISVVIVWRIEWLCPKLEQNIHDFSKCRTPFRCKSLESNSLKKEILTLYFSMEY